MSADSSDRPDVRPPEVRPDVQSFLDFVNSRPVPPISTIPIAEARANYLKMKTAADVSPRPLAVVRDLACPGPARGIPLRFYDARENRQPGPVLMYFHGGGFTIGDLDSHDSLCRDLAAELDLPVVAVDYRLGPEAPFPAAPDDCEAASRWVAESPESLGLEVTGLVTMGDSAGGNLAIVVTQALMDRPAAAPVLLQVPVYPITDESREHASQRDFASGFLLDADSMKYFSKTYAAVAGHIRAFPIHGDHAKMPPTVLVTAGLDPIRDSGRIYGAQLILAGSDVLFVEMKGTIHGFLTIRKAIPTAQEDLMQIVAAIRFMLERPR